MTAVGIGVGWLTVAGATELPVPTQPPLHHTQAWVLVPPDGSTRRVDPSGLARVNGELMVVSDKEEYPDLYVLRPGDAQTVQMEVARAHPMGTAGHDTEGLAACGTTLWAVVEQTPELVRMEAEGPPTVKEIDFSAVGAELPHPALWLNAGLEGVACAPDGRLWVAKEREPRAIFRVDPLTATALEVWRDPADAERTVDGTAFWPSWSGLHFDRGSLYALHRDGHRIVRMNADTGAVTGSLPLDFDERVLYADAAAWGMAEGLWLDADTIWVVLDNNARLLRAGPRAGEPAPLLLRYDRPPGF